MMIGLKWKTLAPNGESFHLARSVLGKGRPAHLHSHDFAEVFWVEEGAGMQYFPGSEVPMEAHDLYVVRAQDAHAVSAGNHDHCVIMNLALPLTVMAELVKRYFPDKVELINYRRARPHFKLNELQVRRLTEMAEQLALDKSGRFVLDRFLVNMFYELFCRADSHLPETVPDWLRKACFGIRDQEKLAEGTAAFVKLAGRCQAHVSRAARQYLGKTPTEIVNEARMAYATRQLLMTDQKIADISCLCGFDSLTHFYKLFHHCCGVSPHQYRCRGLGLSDVPVSNEVMLVDHRVHLKSAF